MFCLLFQKQIFWFNYHAKSLMRRTVSMHNHGTQHYMQKALQNRWIVLCVYMWQDNKHGHMRFLCPEYQPKPYGIVYAHRSASTMCVDKLVLRISRGVFRKYQKHVPMSKHLKQYTMNMYTYTHGNKSFSPCPLGRIIYVRHRSGKRNN